VGSAQRQAHLGLRHGPSTTATVGRRQWPIVRYLRGWPAWPISTTVRPAAEKNDARLSRWTCETRAGGRWLSTSPHKETVAGRAHPPARLGQTPVARKNTTGAAFVRHLGQARRLKGDAPFGSSRFFQGVAVVVARSQRGGKHRPGGRFFCSARWLARLGRSGWHVRRPAQKPRGGRAEVVSGCFDPPGLPCDNVKGPGCRHRLGLCRSAGPIGY